MKSKLQESLQSARHTAADEMLAIAFMFVMLHVANATVYVPVCYTQDCIML